MKKMSREDLETLLKIQNYNNGYLTTKLLYVKFIAKYREKNPDNKFFHNPKNLDLWEKNASGTYLKQTQEFIKLFSQEECPIYWYDEHFWNLFSFKETEEMRYEINRIGRDYSYLSQSMTNGLLKILKDNPSPIFFESFTNFLNKIDNGNYYLVNYWMNLAKKKENQKLIKDKEIFNFVKTFNHNNKKSNRNILKAEVLMLFDSLEKVELIKKIHDENFNDVIVLESTKNLLKQFGINTENKILDFNDDSEEEIKYIVKKYINPQALVQQKIINSYEVETIINGIEKLISRTLNKKGIECECRWTKRFDAEGKEKELYEIKTTSNQLHLKEKAVKIVENILEISIKYILKDDFKDLLKKINKSAYLEKEEAFELFENLIKTASLKEKIENEIEQKQEIKSQRSKI